ncbi:MAG: hypothetical protein EBX35_11540 [Planctomycetia bacterium]|jgi:hypothetical protein|nr:hypothetical protein [Planctomycetia bacterium]
MIRVTDPGTTGLSSMSGLWAIVAAARAGAGDARAAAEGAVPSIGKAIGRGFHAAGFAIGYSFTFPAVLVARIVPQNNPIAYGLADGGRAGLDLARSTVNRPAAEPAVAALALTTS